MADKELKVKISAENQLSGPAGQAAESLKGIGTAAQEGAGQATSALAPMETTVNGVSKSVGGLSRLIYEDTNALKEAAGPADKFDASLSNMDKYAAQAAGSLDGVDKNAGEVAQAVEEAGGAIEDGSSKLDGLVKRFLGFQMITRLAQLGIRQVGESMKRMAEEGDPQAIATQEAMNRAGEAMQKVADAMISDLLPILEKVAYWFEEHATGWDRYTKNQRSYAQATVQAAEAAAQQDKVMSAASQRREYWLRKEAEAQIRSNVAAAERLTGLAKDAEAQDAFMKATAGATSAADLSAMALGRHTLAAASSGEAAKLSAEEHLALRDALNEERRAAEEARLAELEGVLAIAEYGRQMDETFAEANKEKVKLTADQVNELVRGLFNAASEADQLGKNVPLAQVDDLKTRAGKLKTELDNMALTDAEREVLLQYLDLINEKLAAAESRARNAAAAVSGMGGIPGGGGGMSPGGSGSAPTPGGGQIINAAGGNARGSAGAGSTIVNVYVQGGVYGAGGINELATQILEVIERRRR